MKVLVLEADIKIPQEITRTIEDQFSDDEIKYINNVYHADKAALIEGAKWAEAILFQSTFVYEYSISKILELILKVGKPYFVFIQNPEAKEKMNHLMTDEECFEVREKRIKLYQIDYYRHDKYEHPFDLNERAEAYQIEQKRLADIEAKRLAYVQSAANRPTGRKIKIVSLISSPGKEWSSLKEGSIVDEVDMSEVETKFGQGRGVWVMGLTEGVKLLNEHPHREYEIVTEMDEDDVIIEVLTMLGKNDIDQLIFLAIKGMFAQTKQGQLSINDLATEILDLLEVERRSYRTPLRNFLHSKIQLELVY